jgi:hypothetical membrane protein
MVNSIQGARNAVTRVQIPWPQVAIAGAVLTPVLLASLRVLSPEFDPSYRLMSEYALGRYGSVLFLAFVAWGISTCALALAIRSQIVTRGGRVGIAFLFVAGLGEILGGVFDIRHDFMHNVAGAMGILGLPIAAMLVSVSLGRVPEWRPFERQLLVLANLTWISLVLFVATFVLLVVTVIHVLGGLPAQAPPALPHGVIALVGWANRFMVLVYCGWVGAVAAHAIRLPRHRA